jgi:hypothetical protein
VLSPLENEVTVPGTTASERIGVWRRSGEDGWRRDPAWWAEWPRWADVDCVSARPPGVCRILWLGESLARGFFFDPEAPTAGRLQALLRRPGAPPVEVVDLGSNGLTAGQLAHLIDGVPQLGPDAIVVVAGNNWHGAADLDASAARDALAVLREEGRKGLRRWCCESHLPALAARLLRQLAVAAARAGNVPVVVVVPAFNLLDWRATPSQQFPLLTGEAGARWHGLRAAAEADEGNRDEAARRMLALDGGDSPYTHDLLAGAALRRGRPEEARQALEAARDATCSPFLPFLPRCPEALQLALAREAARHGFGVVNLPEIFAARSPGGIPGKHLFLDYCHPSAEGNRLLVEQVAQALRGRVAHLGGPSGTAPEPPRSVRARAHFLAAVHHARYAQPLPALIHHCRTALDLDLGIADLLRWFAGQADSAAPLWLSPEAPLFLRSRQLSRHLLASTPNQPPPFPDALLCTTVAAVLGEAPRPPRGVRGGVDLLSVRWCHRAVDEESPADPGAARAYFRARTPESSFFLSLDAPRVVDLEWTCRGGTPAGDAVLTLSVNGTPQARVALDRAWRTHRVQVPAGSVRAGVNTVTLRWPVPGSAEGVEDAARVWERGEVPDLRPWYGDLFTFQAATG